MEIPMELDECKAEIPEILQKNKLLSFNFNDTLIEDMSAICMSSECSDIVLLVAEERIYAHRIILASRNKYFNALLFGGLKESSAKEIEMKDVNRWSLSAFKVLLKYIYCGIVPFEELTPLVLLDVARLANLYNCTELEKVTLEYLNNILSIDNIFDLYSQAIDYHFDEAIHICLAYMDKNAVRILKQSQFNSLTIDCVILFTSRDSIVGDEFGIFQAVHSWIRANPDADVTELLSNVRLHLIPMEHIMTSVRPSGLYTKDSLMAAIEMKWELGDVTLEYCRTASSPDINLTDEQMNARVIVGERTSSNHDLLRKTSDSDDKEHTLHKITGHREEGILIDLGHRQMINHIKMLLTNTVEERYYYYIEVSLDQKRWVRVVDHRGTWCFGLQDLYFESTVAQYIRIVGTKCTHKGQDDTQYFRVTYFEAHFTNEMKELSDGFLVAKENVATLARGARVRCHGGGTNIAAVLSHNSTCTAQVKCGGYFEVQLAQPYVVNSMRFFLRQGFYHKYDVMVYNNSESIQVASIKADNSASSGWQNIRFQKAEVVSAIKICANEVRNYNNYQYYHQGEPFYCSHFECPSSIQV